MSRRDELVDKALAFAAAKRAEDAAYERAQAIEPGSVKTVLERRQERIRAENALLWAAENLRKEES